MTLIEINTSPSRVSVLHLAFFRRVSHKSRPALNSTEARRQHVYVETWPEGEPIEFSVPTGKARPARRPADLLCPRALLELPAAVHVRAPVVDALRPIHRSLADDLCEQEI